MKRMRPDNRNAVVSQLMEKLKNDWLCRYGEWNRDKLLLDLEQKIRSMRRSKNG